MLRYAITRLAWAIPTLLVLIAVTFALTRFSPGGPFDAERPLDPAIIENLRAAYALDDPLPVQFVNYLGKLLRGDLGPSMQYVDHTVSGLIAGGFPVSLGLGAAAMVLAVGAGVAAGAAAALTFRRPADRGLMAVAMAGISVPNFVVAPLLVLVFAIGLGWLPAGGLGGLRHWILPVVALALPQVAWIARLTRASMLEVLAADYIRTARAKGLPDRLVVWRHALKPALLPVVSYLGPATAAVITGSVVIEEIFAIPGLGRLFVQGAFNRDYTLVMGVVVFYGALIILMNLVADLLYSTLDPRVRTR